jgi:hypothetical protein
MYTYVVCEFWGGYSKILNVMGESRGFSRTKQEITLMVTISPCPAAIAPGKFLDHETRVLGAILTL